MTTPELLPVIQRKNPEREFEILKQIGSGTYGEVFKVGTIQIYTYVRIYIAYIHCILVFRNPGFSRVLF